MKVTSTTWPTPCNSLRWLVAQILKNKERLQISPIKFHICTSSLKKKLPFSVCSETAVGQSWFENLWWRFAINLARMIDRFKKKVGGCLNMQNLSTILVHKLKLKMKGAAYARFLRTDGLTKTFLQTRIMLYHPAVNRNLFYKKQSRGYGNPHQNSKSCLVDYNFMGTSALRVLLSAAEEKWFAFPRTAARCVTQTLFIIPSQFFHPFSLFIREMTNALLFRSLF